MKIGIGLDSSLGLSFAELRTAAIAAQRLGYDSAWTPSGSPDRDGFHLCAQWAAATEGDGGSLPTGIAVVPVAVWSATELARQAITVSAISGGRFTLGIGTGGIYGADYRQGFGLPDYPAVGLMRDYLTALRGLLAGETVTYTGRAVTLRGMQLLARPTPVPLYLAALGPQMLRLAGELADGVALNWCTPEQRAWCRERVNEGTRRAGRDPGAVALMEYIRVCVDDDADRARRGLATAVLGYALSRPGAPKTRGYRAHFARMGFDDVLNDLEARRDAGTSMADLIAACPDDLLLAVGYYGPASGVAGAFKRLGAGLDEAVVRLVPARPGLAAAMTVIEACAPALVAAA